MKTRIRWISGLLLGLISVAFALSAGAAGYEYCPHPDEPNHCYPIYLEEVPFPLDPDPGPYRVVDIGDIANELKRILDIGHDPPPDPWMMLDMVNRQMVVLDLEHQVAFVPEPGRLAMLISGATGLAILARRRRA